MAEGKRNGLPVAAEYEAPEYLAQLEPVVAQLAREVPDAKYDAKGVATLIVQLRQFMEEVMGKNGPARSHPKLPVSLLSDFRPEGAVALLASRLHKWKKQRELRKLDFLNAAQRRQALEALNFCRRELEKARLLVHPIVHIDSSNGPDGSTRLKELVTKLGGSLAEAAGDPNVTHIVYPDASKDDGQLYMRVLSYKDTTALVHWWYTPDSYDERLPLHLLKDEMEPDKVLAGPWQVYARWVTDSEKYNEWMNPIDYETDESIAQQEAAGTLVGPVKIVQQAGGPPLLMRIPTAAEAAAAESRSVAQPTPASMAPRPAKAQDRALASPDKPTLPAAMAGAAASSLPPPSVAGAPPGAPAGAGPAVQLGVRKEGAAAASGPVKQEVPGVKTEQRPAAPVGVAAAGAGPAQMLPPKVELKPPGLPHANQPALPVMTVSQAAARTAAGIRKGNTKRQKLDFDIHEVNYSSAVQLGPGVTRYAGVEVSRAVMDSLGTAENLSQGQLVASRGYLPGQVQPLPVPDTVQLQLPGHTPFTHAVPLFAAWFRWDDVHDIEQAAFPEFFVGQHPARTPEAFQMARNAVIQAYRAAPLRRLLLPHLPAMQPDDADFKARLLAFLDRWGLVNFMAVHPPPHTTPAAVDGTASEALGAPQVAGPAAGVSEPLVRLKIPTLAEGLSALASGGLGNLPVQPRSKAAGPAHKSARALGSAAGNVRVHCSAMPWMDCTAVRYQNAKQPSLELCPAAWAQGLLPPGTTTKDFVKLDRRLQGEAVEEGSGWDACEALLLLEGMEMYGNSWQRVAEHVGGNRTAVQCMLHFLQMPMEDIFLNEMEHGPPSTTLPWQPPAEPTATQSGLPSIAVNPQKLKTIYLPAPPQPAAASIHHPAGGAMEGVSGHEEHTQLPPAQSVEAAVLEQTQLGLTEASNPVVSQAALLSSVLSPQLGAECAAAALAYLSHAAMPAGGHMIDSGATPDQLPVTPEQCKAAASAGLLAAAARARLMAAREEQAIASQVARLCELQASRVDVRLQYLESLSQDLATEAGVFNTRRVGSKTQFEALRRARLASKSVAPATT